MLCTQDNYSNRLEEEYLSFPDELHTVFGEEVEKSRNARVIHSFTRTCQQKNILYMITVGDYEIYIKEQYIVKYFSGHERHASVLGESETVPQSVYLFGTNGTQYWYGTLRGFKERPSMEWLASFGLTPIK